ncbi:GNAT family N-acetyltransferase [Candidatus Electronema sp. PJ]|uniref:GNAT family N-acetyltransferase n=1 Tax=Candidatus Electronema sp. PJ TaxID=3401572 RepID=UPI003AA7C67E
MNAPEQIVIRRAKSADIPALVGLLGLLFSIEQDFVADSAKQQQGLELLLAEHHHAAVLVAEKGERVIGFCTGQLLISTAEGGPAAVIEDVMVLPEWQRQGIGKQLLNAIGEWAASCGASRLHLLADRTNAAALAFYQRVGWQTTQLICLRKFLQESGDARPD